VFYPLSVVGGRLSYVAFLSSVVLYLSVIMSVIGCRIRCRVLTVDCRVSLSLVVVGSWLSGVECLCQLSLSFSIVNAHL
jgi:hypothetical protein